LKKVEKFLVRQDFLGDLENPLQGEKGVQLAKIWLK